MLGIDVQMGKSVSWEGRKSLEEGKEMFDGSLSFVSRGGRAERTGRKWKDAGKEHRTVIIIIINGGLEDRMGEAQEDGRIRTLQSTLHLGHYT